MAKPKKTIHIRGYDNPVVGGIIHAWCDKPQDQLNELATIEGITSIKYNGEFIAIFTDPRYDRIEIEEEIRTLLTAEVTDIFKEG